jgi:hypothetical protein
MTAIIIICGAAVGAVQFFLLKKITDCVLLSGKSPVLPIIFKIVIYAAAAVLLLTVLNTQVINAGIGFGGGITVTTLVYFIIVRCRDNNSTGKEEK